MADRRLGTRPASGDQRLVVRRGGLCGVAVGPDGRNATGLPSEAEWEYGARAGSERKYHSWGRRIPDSVAMGITRIRARTTIGADTACSDGVGKRTAHGRKFVPARMPLGLHDVHGNVWEWVQDCWNESYRGAPTDGSAWTSGNCELRVFRGGSWHNKPGALRAVIRTWFAFGSRGFRWPGRSPLESSPRGARGVADWPTFCSQPAISLEGRGHSTRTCGEGTAITTSSRLGGAMRVREGWGRRRVRMGKEKRAIDEARR